MEKHCRYTGSRLRALRGVALALLALGAAPPVSAADEGGLDAAELRQGRIAFLQCQACHVVTGADSGGKLGPSLAGVFGREAGKSEGYGGYSEALRNAGFTWDVQRMDAWLANPDAYLPGNAMVFPGITDDNKRALLIRYLQQVTATGE